MVQSVVTNATCIACGCTCDDIELHVESDRIVRAENACALGQSWFLGRGHPGELPAAMIGGRAAGADAALASAAAILHQARYPLVFGLGTSTCEAQREAIWLAESAGGVIDGHTSLTHGSTKLAAQLVGRVSCSLGEVKNRADLVIYWGSNPAESHPRHLARYSHEARGKFIPRGRADRTLVVVDVRATATSAAADLFLPIRPNRDFEALSALRALVRGGAVDAPRLVETGLSPLQLQDLVDRMKRARFGVLFFGTGLSATRGKHLNAAAALALVADLNAFTKFAAVPMRDHGNEAGIDYTLTWTTGHPFGVDLSRGYPRANPGEFTAVDLLARHDVDAALIVGDGPWALLPQPALDHLAQIPTIVIDSRVSALSRAARVHFTAGVAGIDVPGTVYRMDKVPLPLRPALAATRPSEEQWLRGLRERVTALAGAGR